MRERSDHGENLPEIGRGFCLVTEPSRLVVDSSRSAQEAEPDTFGAGADTRSQPAEADRHIPAAGADSIAQEPEEQRTAEEHSKEQGCSRYTQAEVSAHSSTTS